jgi:hypothetical protein
MKGGSVQRRQKCYTPLPWAVVVQFGFPQASIPLSPTPTLIASGFNGETNKPMIWTCSGCEATCSHGSMREASISELQ